MYTLYIANKNYSSWSLRPWVLMQSLGIPFQERIQPFDESLGFGQFKDFSPSGRVPCLHDGEIVVWDSLSIAEYLAERHAGVWPTDSAARAWARSAAAEMHSGFQALRDHCLMSCGIRVRLHEIPVPVAADIGRIDALWSEGLQRFGGPFLAGASFTAIDAFFAPVVFRIQTYGLPVGQAAKGYMAHMLAQPAMRAWYEQALAETWRDPPHEEDTLRVGTIIEDARATA
ncbi:MAG TPA: glutathione S-transferase family protein [Dyella sp.]|uniref:glutathione S-transferase family protein n=1 Tax=Dyella sp. TaxID=1869338 RepID=UPI002F91D59F